MSAAIDRFVEVLKWPVALVALLLLPSCAWAFWNVLAVLANDFRLALPFLGGFAAYVILWLLFLRRPGWGYLVSTFEHELTHAIFAWLTLHRVTGLRTSWRSGGEMTFVGRGNWLISVAPYFFPTLSLIVLIVLAFIPPEYLSWATAALGVTVAYHITSTWKETHWQQTDLQRVSFAFSFLFLPTANLLAFGMVLAFVTGGLDPVVNFFTDIGDNTLAIIHLFTGSGSGT